MKKYEEVEKVILNYGKEHDTFTAYKIAKVLCEKHKVDFWGAEGNNWRVIVSQVINKMLEEGKIKLLDEVPSTPLKKKIYRLVVR